MATELELAQLLEDVRTGVIENPFGEGLGLRQPSGGRAAPLEGDEIATQFIRRLANDVITNDDVQSMEALVENLLQQTASPQEAAQMLYESLFERGAPQDLPQNGPERLAWNQIQRGIEEIFENGGSAADIAQQLREGTIAAPTVDDQNRRVHLWELFAQGGADFDIALTEDQIELLKYALNQIVPGMGDFVGNILGDFGALEREESLDTGDVAQRQAMNSFEGAWEAMQGNAGLAALHGIPSSHGEDSGGQPIYVTPWNSHPSNDSEFAQFFRSNDEIDPSTEGSTYMFYPPEYYPEGHEPIQYHDDLPPGVMYANFEDMILRPMEERGAIAFENDEARADFIQYAEQRMVGGEFRGAFAEHLEREGVVSFESEAARQEFIESVGRVDPRITSGEALAAEVISVVEAIPGANFEAADPEWDDNVYYAEVQQRVMEVTEHYELASDGADFAAGIQAYAATHDGIVTDAVVPPEVVEPRPGVAEAVPEGVEEELVEAAYVGLTARHEGDGIEYGEPIEITTGENGNFAEFEFLQDPLTLHGINENGYLVTLEPQGGDFAEGTSIQFAADQFDGLLSGDGFTIQAVYDVDQSATAPFAYRIENADGEGFEIVIQEATNEFIIGDAELRSELQSGEHAPANVNAEPEVAANVNAAPSQDMTDPDARAGIAIGPQ